MVMVLGHSTASNLGLRLGSFQVTGNSKDVSSTLCQQDLIFGPHLLTKHNQHSYKHILPPCKGDSVKRNALNKMEHRGHLEGR